MILDLLANRALYDPLHPRLRHAFDWLAGLDFATVADGTMAIDGDNIHAIVESGTTADPATRRFETHRRYLDIQYVIGGGERMGWCPTASLAMGEQAGPDLWFHVEPTAGQQILVAPGHFVIFAPGEGHKPLCHLGDAPAPFRKCIVKVSWI